jgi:hypothetical protein
MTIIGKPVYSDELLHYQVKGAKWGVRRWQYPDGSLTPEGRIHYGIGPARDKDPDLDHPIEKAKADVERVSTEYERWQGASSDVKRYAKESNARRKLFEKRSDYDERIKTAKMRLNLAENAEIIYGNKFDDARKEAQARFDKYMQISDELSSDIDWIDMHMYLETGEAGSKQTYIDRDEMENIWSELQEAVDIYWYDGLMNHDRAMNANDEYRDKFEMNDSPRGKEAAREQTAKFALRNVNGRKSKDLSSAVINAKNTSDIRKFSEFKNIDTSELSKSIKTSQDHRLSSDNKKVIDRIADSLLGEHGNQEFTTSWGQKMRVKDAVSSYIEEKAYAESTDDIGDLTSMWESYSFYDVTDKLNRELKKQQKS